MLHRRCSFKVSFYLPPPCRAAAISSRGISQYTPPTQEPGRAQLPPRAPQNFIGFAAVTKHICLHSQWVLKNPAASEVKRWQREHPSQSCFKGSLSNDFSFQDVTQKNNWLCPFSSPPTPHPPSQCLYRSLQSVCVGCCSTGCLRRRQGRDNGWGRCRALFWWRGGRSRPQLWRTGEKAGVTFSAKHPLCF